ncbi:hypothetical protein C0J52_17533 [Blattella germanica]|nr:hypothetical protein C0J52_17533 [Blattella germanica]
MASCPRPSSLTSLADINYVRRMSAPVAVNVRRSSPVSSAASSYNWRRSSLAECNLWDRPRRQSLADTVIPRPLSSDGRKLSLVESSIATNSNSDSSVEIDTSSLSYDLVSTPRGEPSCAGSYQPIPPDQLPECAIRNSPGAFTLISASRPVWRALMFGQLMSLLLCTMAACNYYLSTRHQIALPTGKNQLLGDMLCLGGAIMFAVVTVVQELVVKTLDSVEYLGMIGLFGSLYSIIQTAVLERHIVLSVPWGNWQVVSLLLAFGLAQFLFHIFAPAMLRETGATALQLSLLTADFYWLMLNFHALYFLSFTLTATGVMIYAVKRTPISSQSQQPASYRINTPPADMELVTPMSDLVSSSICPSRSTELSAGSPDSQTYRMNGDALFY